MKTKKEKIAALRTLLTEVNKGSAVTDEQCQTLVDLHIPFYPSAVVMRRLLTLKLLELEGR